MSASRKRADYAFLAPNFRDVLFYVEAKKPHGGLDTSDNYFQTIRYGWNSQNSLAVLTDFEHLHVLDSRYKPDIDTALLRAVKKFHYTDYFDAEKFKEIYYLFSREAVTHRSIDKFAATLAKPTGRAYQRTLFRGGYQAVDEHFLQELDGYRDELARSFKNHNPHLNSEELTEVTQRTLDRLVFMRFLEDKLIEPEPLVERLGEKGTAWQDFISTSRRLDGIYNGIIFKKHALLDSAKLKCDERVFASIRESLAHTNSPYDFNTIPIHVLGSIYERFLGKVIVATEKRARVEEKPEVRKAGGVYYTPEYIVTYVVKNTVGKLIEGKTPDQISKLHFADIACGSGSFLLGVYDLLLRYQTAYYNQSRNRAQALKAGCIERDGAFYLSLHQKKEILIKNIYGVDLDAQAVEVAQLSLFLKLLEDETTASARGHQLEFKETMLPSLDKNIIHGNSLVGWDILDGRLFEGNDERKLYPLDFVGAFPKVMLRGGFDAIVGNPPYGRDILSPLKQYFDDRYESSQYKLDSFVFFIEKAITLLRPEGKLGYIVPNSWLDTQSFSRLRRLIVERTRIKSIINLGKDIFAGANVDTMLLLLQKTKRGNAKVEVIDASEYKLASDRLTQPKRSFHIPQSVWANDPQSRFDIHASPEERKVFLKMRESGIVMDDFTDCSQGLIPYNTKEMSQKNPFLSTEKKGDEWKPLFDKGACVGRYELEWNGVYVKFGSWLYTANKPRFYENAKILIQRHRNPSLLRRIVATFDAGNFYFKDNLCCLIAKNDTYDLKFLLGVLNSRIMNEFYRKTFTEVSLNPTYLRQLPLPVLNMSQRAGRSQHDKIVKLVDTLLESKRTLRQSRTESEVRFYENKCSALDRQIDAIVYELYGLTAEEIAVVEASPISPSGLGVGKRAA